MRHILLPILGLFSLLPALQSQVPAKPAEPTPILDLYLDGPGMLRQKLLPTNLGGLLAGEQGKDIWSQLWGGLGGQLLQQGMDREQADALVTALRGYRGQLRFRLYPGADRHSPPQVLILFSDDGQPGFGKLRDGLTELLGAGAQPRQRAGFDWGPLPVSLPRVLKGGFALAAGPLAEGLDPQALLAAMPKPKPTDPFLKLVVDTEVLAEKVRGESMGAFAAKILGVDAWTAMELRLAAIGPHVVADFELGLDPKEHQGVLAGFLPPVAGVPQLQALVPGDGQPWTLGRFELRAFVDAVIKVVAEEGFIFRGPSSVEEIKASMNAELGIDLHQELLERLGNGYMVIGRFKPGSSTARDIGVCFAARAKQPDKALAALRTVLSKTFANAQPEKIQHAGVELQVIRQGRETVSTASKGGVLLLGIGSQGLVELQAALDRLAAGAQAAAVPALTRAGPLQLPGLNGMGLLPTETLGHSMVSWMVKELWKEVLPPIWRKGELPLQNWLKSAKRHRLKHMVWYSAYAKGRHTIRFAL